MDQMVLSIFNGPEVPGDIGESMTSQKTACIEEVGEETEGESNWQEASWGRKGGDLGVRRVEKRFLFSSYQT